MRDAKDLANVIERATIVIKQMSGQWQLADDGKAMIVAALRASQSEAERLVAARKLVDKQAEDAGLWFEAQTAPEGYLQAALRELHAVIEVDSWFAPEEKV